MFVAQYRCLPCVCMYVGSAWHFTDYSAPCVHFILPIPLGDPWATYSTAIEDSSQLLVGCAGRADGVIARENVLEHYAHMRDAGLNVTYKEFEAFGHLDFTFAIKDDLRHYVLSRLLLRH